MVMDSQQWWKEAVVYQVYPRSFQDTTGSGVGDLNGITQRLDYLQELGIDVIWLSPIYQSPGVDNGYDISDYQAINPEFGTMADFDRLLTETHKRGIKIVMDLVVNHTSDQHPWFIESRSSRSNQKRDWYIWRDGIEEGPPNDLRSVFSGSAWEKDARTGQYYMHLFAVQQPDLNWANSDVRNAVYDMMKFWLDKGIDGFRMDVIDAISKPASALAVSKEKAETPFGSAGVHPYLKEMRQKVLAHYNIMTVGETPSATTESARLFAGNDGSELNMIFQFEHAAVDHDKDFDKWLVRKYQLSALKRILSKWQIALHNKAWNSLFWDNHDQPRVVSRFGDDSTDETRTLSAKMLATCLHLMQGTPYIYQGEELGMTNAPFETLDDCRDIEIFNAYRELVTEKKLLTHKQIMESIQKLGRDNARTPMQWDTTKNAGFSTGTPWIAVHPNYLFINAATQVGMPDSVWSYYKRLIALRKKYPVIVHGDYELLFPDDEKLFVYRRHFEKAQLLVISNFSGDTLPLTAELVLDGELLIANYPATAVHNHTILPWEARVYIKH
jgi:oligo-1,6-glucosidase